MRSRNFHWAILRKSVGKEPWHLPAMAPAGAHMENSRKILAGTVFEPSLTPRPSQLCTAALSGPRPGILLSWSLADCFIVTLWKRHRTTKEAPWRLIYTSFQISVIKSITVSWWFLVWKKKLNLKYPCFFFVCVFPLCFGCGLTECRKHFK